MHIISSLIRQRRAIFPKSYLDQEIPAELITEILENAHWAPTHKRTEPWRFKIFHSLKSRQDLAAFIANDYKQHTNPDLFSEVKQNEMAGKPLQSACTIAICMQRDPAQSLPEWEEIAAVACAVQNMWLTCTAYHIGSYWASPGFINRMATFLELAEGEKCLGLFYMGPIDPALQVPGWRSPLADKLRFIK